MKYRAEYTLRFEEAPEPEIVGESIEVRDALCQFTSVDVDRRVVHIDVTVPVETDGLTLGTGPEPPNGSEPQRGVVVPERAAAIKIARGLSRALAFARGHAVHLSVRGSEAVLPETDLDRDVLAALGADQPLQLLVGRLSDSNCDFISFDVRTLARLLEREVGLALDNDAVFAIATGGAIPRVLASARGCVRRGRRRLAALLSAFPPAQELGFTETELEAPSVTPGPGEPCPKLCWARRVRASQ